MRPFLRTTVFAISLIALAACAKSGTTDSSSASEDASASGIAASSVGGAIGASDTNGTVALNKSNLFLSILWEQAYASTSCPSVKSANGSGCTQNGNAADIGYSSCSFGAAKAAWTGTLEMTLSGATAVTCGTYPNTATLANNQSIQRQFVTSGAPGTASRTSSAGTVVTIDHASANLANFDTGTTVAANIGSGYGTQVVFDGSGHRKSVVIAQRIYSAKMDHSISGTLTISESGTTRTISSGSIKVFHNLMKVVGTSTFNNVVYNNQCCTPISGSISTVFAAGAHVAPNTAGAALVGKTETLTFNGCGGATLLDGTGVSATVAMTSCF